MVTLRKTMGNQQQPPLPRHRMPMPVDQIRGLLVQAKNRLTQRQTEYKFLHQGLSETIAIGQRQLDLLKQQIETDMQMVAKCEAMLRGDLPVPPPGAPFTVQTPAGAGTTPQPQSNNQGQGGTQADGLNGAPSAASVPQTK